MHTCRTSCFAIVFKIRKNQIKLYTNQDDSVFEFQASFFLFKYSLLYCNNLDYVFLTVKLHLLKYLSWINIVKMPC